MKRVHRREASEGHWASEGMCGDSRGKGGGEEKGVGRKKEKGKGGLEGAVTGGRGD